MIKNVLNEPVVGWCNGSTDGSGPSDRGSIPCPTAHVIIFTMDTLYLLGGSARSGKTIIFNKIINSKPMMAISSDALREGIRNVLLDESYVSVQNLSLSGDATFHRPGENKDISHTKHFSKEFTENEFTWKTIVGLINHYDRHLKKDVPLIIEGVAITPERVNSLQLKNTDIKAAFLGCTEMAFLENILEYSKKHKDWVYKAIQENNGDDASIREWFTSVIKESKQMAIQAEKFGYAFFPVDSANFEKYCNTVADYFLQ